MMIKIMGFENPIEFKENFVNVLEIPNTKQFSNFVLKFNNVYENTEDNEIVLLSNGEKQDFSKNTMIISDILNIDFNDKKIISNIYEILSLENQKDTSIDNEYENITKGIYNYLLKVINNLPFECYITKEIKLQDLLKIANFKISKDYYTTILEKILLLIDIFSIINNNVIIILINLKSFLAERELLEFYKYTLYKNIKILLIDNKKQDVLRYENKNILDDDYYDYIQMYK